MSWWVIGIQIGLAILRQLIKPKVKRPRGQDLEGWFADEGRTIPQIYGTQSISPNVVWWGKAKQHDGQDPPYPTLYYAKLIGTLCMGPVAELVDIQSGGKSLALEPITRAQSFDEDATSVVTPLLPQAFDDGSAPLELRLAARSIFGGINRDGGIEGYVRLYPGTPAQGIDAVTTESTANEAIPDGTGRPGVCYVVFDKERLAFDTSFFWGFSATPKEMVFVLRTEPTALLELGLNPNYTSARIGANLNPGEMIFDLACHEIRGAGADPALIDVQSIADLAAVLEDEQFGLSATLGSPDEASDLLEEILRHIDGGRTEDPETGLVSFYLVRPDPEIVAEITDSNTDALVVEEPNYRELVNDVQLTHREWAGGVSGSVVNEVLTKNIQFLGLKNRYYQSKGRNISNVHAYADGVELTGLVDYDFDSVSGLFVFGDTAAISPGQTITISYTSLPTAMALVEATAKDYDLADQQITQEVRSMTVDFPYIPTALLGQMVARRTLRAFGLPLKSISFSVNRTGHRIRPGKAVRINSAKWNLTNFIARILPPTDHGTLEQGKIKVKAIEDVWGTAFLPILPTGSGVSGVVPPTAPGMTISCGAGGTLVRIAFWVTDPTFDIELWRADDELGTGAVLVTTLPGSTAFWDDGTDDTKAHRARMVRPGFTEGAYTPWLTCDLSGGDPEDPEVILPVVLEMPSQTETVGTLLLDITDPQHRVTLVEFRHQAGAGAETAFTTDSATPYSDDVDLLFPVPSRISYRVSYIGETGETAFIEGTVTFEEPTTPPIGLDAAGGNLLVPFHTTLTHGADFRHPPAETAELAQYGRRRIDLGGFAKCQVQIHTRLPLPAGSTVSVQYVPATNTDPAEEDWLDLGEFGGPLVAADVATANPTVSPVVSIALLARQDVVLRPVSTGGDDATQFDTLEMLLYVSGTPAGGNNQNVPDPCEDTSISFGGYEDQAALEAAWAFDEGEFDTSSMTLDLSGGEDGGRALKIFTATGTHPGHQGPFATLLLTGLPVGADVSGTARMKTDPGFGISTGVPSPPFDGPIQAGLSGGVFSNADHDLAGEWQTIEFAAATVPMGGELTFSFGWGSIPFFTTYHGTTIWLDSVTLLVDGELISPCSGGPTIPGDGGFEPPPDLPPPLPPPDTGLRSLLLWHLPAPYTAYPPVYGTLRLVTPSNIIATLDGVRAAGCRIVLAPMGSAKVNGVWSLSKQLATLEGFVGIDISSYTDVVAGILVIDEPFCAPCKGLSAPIQWSTVDGVLGKRTSEIFPDTLLWVRENAIQIMKRGVVSQYIRGAWCQWGNRAFGEDQGIPTVGQYMAANQTAAASLSMQIMWGINTQDYSPTRRIITADELRRDGSAMARDQNAYGVALWAGLTVSSFDPSFLQTAPYVAAMNDIVAAMTP